MEKTMKCNCAIGILLAALALAGSARLSAQDNEPDYMVKPLLPDGETVFDTYNYRFWLADANLPATDRFGLPLCESLEVEPTEPCVNASGSMNYASAVAWVKGMNDAGYLGRHDWQLPATPRKDPSCSSTG